MKLRSKKFAAICCAAVLAVSCAIPAFASSYSYPVITTTGNNGDGNGPWYSMDSSNGERIEYTSINANCSISSATATLELYQSSFPANTWMSSNQTIKMGTGRRAYWLGCPNNYYSIHAYPHNNSSGNVPRAITMNGTFQNY